MTAAPASGIARWVPGLRTAREYRRSWLTSDLVGGLVLSAILVPQGMAYAELAGLPPVTGLYTTIGCLVGYAVFGPSRVLVLGPDSSVSPMIFAAILPLIAGGGESRAIALAGMLALIVGLIEVGLGVARFGFIADLLSNEVQVGYMNGLALVIVVGQLPKLFGFSTDATGFGPELKAFVDHLDKTAGASLLVGLGVLALLVLLPRLTRRIPAVLVAIVVATAVSAGLDLQAHGVKVVGSLPRGVPVPSVPFTKLADVAPLLVAAVGITFVSLADTIATATSFGARRGEEVQPDQEMIGIGAANLCAGLMQGFAVSTSGSRTAVVEQAGAKSQLASVVGAGVVVALLLFFNSLLADLPQAALAAILIVAAFSLLDLGALRRYARVRRSALVLSLVATLGVVVLGVLQGIVIAIALAILLFFRRSWQPHGEVLGFVRELAGWHAVERYPDAEQVPGVVVLRWEAPLFFANSSRFRSQVRRLVRELEASWVVVQGEAITDLDVTATGMLGQLDRELNDAGVHLAFVELRDRVQDLVERYGLTQTLDAGHFYPSIEAALAADRARACRGRRRGWRQGALEGGGVVSAVQRPSGRERGLAIASLACTALLAVGLIVFLVNNPLEVVVGLLGLLVAIAGGWWAIAERLPRRALGVVGLLVGIGAIVWAIVAAGSGGRWYRLIIGLALLVGAMTTGRATLLEEIRDDERRRRRRIPPPRHPVVICNPRSGGGKVHEFGLVELAERLGVEAVLLQPGDDLEQLARDAVRRGADCLGMAGGDGSQALVASVAVEHDLPFVCVSAGTRNHFALDLGLDRDDPRRGLSAFGDGVVRFVDYATIGDRLFVNNVSLGVYATIVQQEGYRDAKRETSLTLLPELLGRQTEPFDLQFTTPDGTEVDGTFLVMVSNNPYVLGASLDMARRRRLDSGRLGVFAVTASNGTEAAQIVTGTLVARGSPSGHAYEFTTEQFEVRSRSGWCYAGVDGEALELQTPLEMQIHPRGLQLLVPKENVEIAMRREARQVKLTDLVAIARGARPLTGAST